jgi:hypothetical protein
VFVYRRIRPSVRSSFHLFVKTPPDRCQRHLATDYRTTLLVADAHNFITGALPAAVRDSKLVVVVVVLLLLLTTTT